MKMCRTRARRILILIALALPLLPQSAAGQTYPDRPLRIVVPIDAGSTTDFIARTIGERLRGPLGQNLIVENRSGAGGSIGSAVVAKSAPDGYTLLIASSAHTVNPAIYSALPYNTRRDFAGVSMLVTLPNVLVVSPAKGVTSMKALIDLAKARPGELNYGSGGVGSAAHMNAEQFRAAAKFDAVHVPYKGTPDVVNGLISGRLDFAFVPITTALPHLRAGKLAALALGSIDRTPLLPNIPTTEASGVPGSAYNVWIGMFVRAGTPREIVNRLNREVRAVLADPAMAERLAGVGAAPAAMSAEDFDNYVSAEIDSVAQTVKLSGIPTN